MSPALQLTLLAGFWLFYALLHSLLAANRSKRAAQRRFPRQYRCYRLCYNLLAAVLLLPPLALLAGYPPAPLWRWTPPLSWFADAAALLALAGFLWSLRYYDMAEFLGTRQWRRPAADSLDQAPLTLSPLHRWVRHPWYFFALVILWTREMNAALLLTAVLLTLYLIVGSRLEENKLIALYGDSYKRYRALVPGLLPLPWRHLSMAEADQLLRQSRDRSPPEPFP